MQIYNDELYHSGKLGMKWHYRKAKFMEGVQAQKQANRDQLLHPIHSTAAQISMLKKNPIRTLKGGTKVLNELNAEVKNRVENSKKSINHDKRKDGFKKTGKTLKNIGHLVLKADQKYQEQKMANQIFR